MRCTVAVTPAQADGLVHENEVERGNGILPSLGPTVTHRMKCDKPAAAFVLPYRDTAHEICDPLASLYPIRVI
jgi:hypothetical protein